MEYVHLYDQRLTNADYLSFSEDGRLLVLAVFGEMDGTYVPGGRSTSYIDFGNGDIDTLQVSGPNSSSLKVVHDVWYNGKHVQWIEHCDFIPCGFVYVK